MQLQSNTDLSEMAKSHIRQALAVLGERRRQRGAPAAPIAPALSFDFGTTHPSTPAPATIIAPVRILPTAPALSVDLVQPAALVPAAAAVAPVRIPTGDEVRADLNTPSVSAPRRGSTPASHTSTECVPPATVSKARQGRQYVEVSDGDREVDQVPTKTPTKRKAARPRKSQAPVTATEGEDDPAPVVSKRGRGKRVPPEDGDFASVVKRRKPQSKANAATAATPARASGSGSRAQQTPPPVVPVLGLQVEAARVILKSAASWEIPGGDAVKLKLTRLLAEL